MLSDEHKEQMKREMLVKCFELFVNQGLENTSLNELVAHCNVHKATFYRYLHSKDEIVIESVKMHMQKVGKLFFDTVKSPQCSLQKAMQKGVEIITGEKDKLRFVYQVISSPKYGEQGRYEIDKVYTKHMCCSKDLAKTYNVDHAEFRPYFLLYIATIHDFCLWEDADTAKEKLDFIYEAVEKLS